MPAVQIDSYERKRVEDLVEFVQRQFADLTGAGKSVFALLLARRMGLPLQQALNQAKLYGPDPPAAGATVFGGGGA
jgi:hypothetical protein